MTPDPVQARLEGIERNVAEFNHASVGDAGWLCQQVHTLLARVAELDQDRHTNLNSLSRLFTMAVRAEERETAARQQLAAARGEVARLAKGHDEYNRVNRILETELEAAQERIGELESGVRHALSADGVNADDAPERWGNTEAAAWVEGYEAGQGSFANPLIPLLAAPQREEME